MEEDISLDVRVKPEGRSSVSFTEHTMVENSDKESVAEATVSFKDPDSSSDAN